MAAVLRSGLAAQIGYGEESPWGTRAVPTVFVPLVDEGLTEERERLESEGIVPGVSTIGSDQWNGGPVTVGGDVGHELYTSGIDLLLKHMFGAVATTGAGPYTKTFSPTAGSLDGKGLTVQVGRPGVDGTVHPFDYTGCKVAEWEIACSEGEIATLGLTLVGKRELTDQALATATYSSGVQKPFKFNHGHVVLNGSPLKVTEATVAGSNGLKDDRRFLSQADDGTIDEPLEESLREHTAEATVEFAGLAHRTRLVAGTELPFLLNFTAGAAQFEVGGNVRDDCAAVNVGGREVLEQELALKFIRSGATDATAITAKTINTVASV